MQETILETLDINCPAYDRPYFDADLESSIDMSGDSMSFLFRRPKKTLADSDTVSTYANSSFTSSFRSNVERPRKCVKFALDDNDEPLTEEFESEGPLSPEEVASIWWQPLEFRLFRRYCKKTAEAARQSDYVDRFTRVYDICSGKHINDLTEHTHISRSTVRGLEAVVFPALVQARKLVVRGVVKTQIKLPEYMSAEERARVISATSRCLTGRARMLARVYGVGDEEVAKDCYYSMAAKAGTKSEF